MLDTGKKRLLPILSVCAVVPLLAACQPQTSGPLVTDARDDICAIHRATFRQTEPSFSVGERAALAIGAGALAGIATGLITRNAGAGFAVGASIAAVGVTAVLIDANFQTMQAEQRRQALLNQAAAVDSFGAKVTGAQLALEQLTRCRREQVQAVRVRVRSGGMPRPDGEARMREIRGWFDDDVTLVRSFDQRLAGESRLLADSSRNINGGGLATEAGFRPFTGIAARTASLRASASDSAADSGSLRPGQSVRVTARDGQWLRVQPTSGGRPSFVSVGALAREAPAREFRGSAEGALREAALDEASERGRIASGSPYRVIGTMPGWLVVDQGSQRSFVRATALRPSEVDGSGRDVLQSAATAVSARDAFASGADSLAREARSVSFEM